MDESIIGIDPIAVLPFDVLLNVIFAQVGAETVLR
jgi:hypothetical protein